MADPKPAPVADAPKSEIAQLVEVLRQQNPTPLDQLGISPERQRQLLSRQPGRRYRDIPVVGENGSRAILTVVEEGGCPNGKGVWLREYKHPKGMLKHISEGGLVPDGMPIAFDRMSEVTIAMHQGEDVELRPEAFALPYVMWKRAEFYQRDRDAWIGKEIKAHHCDPAGKGLQTTWSDAAS